MSQLDLHISLHLSHAPTFFGLLVQNLLFILLLCLHVSLKEEGEVDDETEKLGISLSKQLKNGIQWVRRERRAERSEEVRKEESGERRKEEKELGEEGFI
jgi:hypothetical protein